MMLNLMLLQTALYPKFVILLRLVGNYNHTCPIIVTCRLRHIWEKIMIKSGFSTGPWEVLRLRIEFFVASSVKKAMIAHMK